MNINIRKNVLIKKRKKFCYLLIGALKNSYYKVSMYRKKTYFAVIVSNSRLDPKFSG